VGSDWHGRGSGSNEVVYCAAGFPRGFRFVRVGMLRALMETDQFYLIAFARG